MDRGGGSDSGDRIHAVRRVEGELGANHHRQSLTATSITMGTVTRTTQTVEHDLIKGSA